MQELICATFTYILTYVELKLCVHWAMAPTLFLLWQVTVTKGLKTIGLEEKGDTNQAAPQVHPAGREDPGPGSLTGWVLRFPEHFPAAGLEPALREWISHYEIIRKEPRTPEKSRMFKVEGRRCCMVGADVKHQMGPSSRCRNKKFITVQENNKTSLIPWNNCLAL